jgi:ribonuclease HI
VTHFEKRINFWCNKWLSLGGRYILVKSVLESLLLYWMSLEKIPNKIHILLRRLIFNFLWNSHPGHYRFHLCNWTELTKPRRYGGWGLMNLPLFNTALLVSSFWRAVSIDGIWHRIIADKYLGSRPLACWIRKPVFQLRSISSFWKGLVTSNPVILHWLVWNPGDGTEVRLGCDKILGLGDRSLLSFDLRSLLRNQNLTHLDQINLQTGSCALPDRWLDSGDLHLCNPLASEWNLYIAALKEAGITLSSCPDTLRWVGGDATGNLTVKNLYAALLNQKNLVVDRSWFSHIWRWEIPLKIKLFIWLAGKEKLLSWDMLRRRGWEGPSYCSLCRKATEDINHLLVHCPFTQMVWSRVLSHLSLQLIWNGNTLSNSYTRWLEQPTAPKSLPALVSWQIWIARNRAIFDSRPPTLQSVVQKLLGTYNWKQPPPRPLKLSVCDVHCLDGYTVAYFDGAARASGDCCGAGGLYKSHSSRVTYWYLNCGAGTNNRAELLGLWAALYLASVWSISHLHVLGDSRLIIDWISQKSKLQSVHNDSWMDKSLKLVKTFSEVSFHHIPRSFNTEADVLSKRALKGAVGRLSMFHRDGGIESPSTSINVFE